MDYTIFYFEYVHNLLRYISVSLPVNTTVLISSIGCYVTKICRVRELQRIVLGVQCTILPPSTRKICTTFDGDNREFTA